MDKRILTAALALISLINPQAQAQEGPNFANAEEAVRFGLSNSKGNVYQYLQAINQMSLANLQFRSLLPSISLSVNDTDRMNYDTADTRSKTISLSLSQNIYDGGKTAYQYQIGKISSRYGYEDSLLILRTYQASVIEAYYDLLTQIRFLEIEDELLRLADEQLVIVKKEFEIGSILEVDYLDYQIQHGEIRLEREDYYRDLERKKRNFAYLLGLEKPILTIGDTMSDLEESHLLGDYGLIIGDLTVLSSLELKKKKLEQGASRSSYEYMKKSMIPTVGIEGSLSFSGTAYPLYNPSYGIKLILSFSDPRLPLRFSSGINHDGKNITGTTTGTEATILQTLDYGTSKKAAEIRVREGERQIAELERSIKDGARDRVLDHDRSIQTLESQKNALSLLERKAAFSRIRSENGEITRVDYLKDMVALSKKKMEVVQLTLGILSERHAIELSLGLNHGELDDFLRKVE